LSSTERKLTETVNILKRLAGWLDRVTTPPPRPILPNIFTDTSVKRTYHLLGDGPASSSGYTAEWDELPLKVVEEFVEAFDVSSGWELNVPYVQFYASPTPHGKPYTADLIGYNIGALTIARGKIRPSETSGATLNPDGSVTFTYVNLELTASEQLRDLPLAVASITITANGELVVTETDE
jgi:hypothetical protein